MNIQNVPEPNKYYPLLTTDIEVKRREIQQHTSSTGASEEGRKLQASVSEIVLAPALSIVPEEEEAPITPEVYAATRTTGTAKEYSYKLVCCRNQLGIGMSNPGPR